LLSIIINNFDFDSGRLPSAVTYDWYMPSLTSLLWRKEGGHVPTGGNFMQGSKHRCFMKGFNRTSQL